MNYKSDEFQLCNRNEHQNSWNEKTAILFHASFTEWMINSPSLPPSLWNKNSVCVILACVYDPSHDFFLWTYFKRKRNNTEEEREKRKNKVVHLPPFKTVTRNWMNCCSNPCFACTLHVSLSLRGNDSPCKRFEEGEGERKIREERGSKRGRRRNQEAQSGKGN